MGEIHELFVLALSLVWFAGATPEKKQHKFTVVAEIITELIHFEPENCICNGN